jgi:hypothetical protein
MSGARRAGPAAVVKPQVLLPQRRVRHEHGWARWTRSPAFAARRAVKTNAYQLRIGTGRTDKKKRRMRHPARADANDSQPLFQVFGTQLSVAQNALQDLRMEDFLGVKRNRNPFACGILVNQVAAALPTQCESSSLQYAGNLAGCEAWQFRHQTATSTVERLTDTAWGISSPPAMRSSRCN